ncbi:MAG: putative quinol monooxygenase [Pseudomonadota bacterium]
MFAVVVRFQLRADAIDRFLPLMLKNAQISKTDEPGCHQFDVLTDPARPDEVFLYELYTDKAAFDAHLASAHFKAFDAAVTDMIADKGIRTYATVAQ